MRNTKNTTCNNDGACRWDPTNLICVTKCELITAQAQCQSESSVCAWDQEFLTCGTLCSVKYPDGVGCDADPLCGFNNATKKCEKACNLLTAESYCVAQSSCQWDSAKQTCAPDCTTYTNDAACVGSGLCQYNAGGSGCQTSCELRRTTKSACASDPECLWDSKGATCRAACTTIASATTCAASAVCELDLTGKCVMQCSVQYPSQDSCTADSRCQWDSNRLTCFTKCDQVSSVSGTQGTCTRNPACQYEVNSCKPACSSLASCSSDSTCTVNPLGNCVLNCAGKVQSDCQQFSACRWDGSACTSSCKESYAKHQTDCTADSACQWDATTSTCSDACSVLTGTTDCKLNGQCMQVNQTCKTTCAVSYTTAAACQADSDCVWDPTRQECRRTCSSIGDSGSCTSDPDCKWVGQLQTCRRACEILSSADCLQNRECEVTPDGSCMPTCAYRYGVRESCNNDPTCEWFSKSGTCGEALCVATTESVCVADTRCRWNSTLSVCTHAPCQWSDDVTCALHPECEWYAGNQTCIGKICPDGLPQAACDSRAGWCKFDSATGVCAKTCPMYGDKDGCQAAQCDWTFEGTCDKPCGQKYTTDRPCNLDDNCEWDNVNSVCVGTCSKSSTATSCVAGKAGVCLWQNGNCKMKCSIKYAGDPTGCAADKTCELVDDGTGVQSCIEPCRQLAPGVCNQTDGCQQTPDGSCLTTCAGKYATAASCLADSTCMWSGSPAQCQQGCEQKQGQAVCQSAKTGLLDTCTWNGTACITPCQYRYATVDACNENANCVWDAAHTPAAQCVAACSTYTDPGSCPGGACLWDTTATPNVCVRSCSAAHGTDAAACSADKNCQWDLAQGQCGPKTCTGTDEGSCTRDPGEDCQWDATSNTCQGPCSNIGVETGCDAAGGRCTWLATAAKCTTTCSTMGQTDCAAHQDTCMFVAGACHQSCTTGTTEVACNDLGVLCDWDDGVRSCKVACTWRYGTDMASCAADASCIVVNGNCKGRKCYYTTATSCANDPQCGWDAASSTCGQKNCSYTTQTACEAANCQWTSTPTGTGCGPQVCDPTASAQNCKLNAACTFDGTSCIVKPCYAPTREDCLLNSSCTWDLSKDGCTQRPADCVYTAWSAWTPCSSTCEGVETRQRAIRMQPTAGGKPCDQPLQEEKDCGNQTCDCTTFMTNEDCALHTSCQWYHDVCYNYPAPTSQDCSKYTTPAQCNPSYCLWLVSMCVPNSAQTPMEREAVAQAVCNTANNETDVASDPPHTFSWATPVQPFASVKIDGSQPVMPTRITAAIERGYSLKLDQLYLGGVSNQTYGMNATWFVHIGTLVIHGEFTMVQVGAILSDIFFVTASASSATRRITWNIGTRTIYTSGSNKLLKFYPPNGPVDWWRARSVCESSHGSGVVGRLASVTSMEDSNAISTKLLGYGWMGATDNAVDSQWVWATPESPQFWQGATPSEGGKPVNNAFANWDPAGRTTTLGEPLSLPGFAYGRFGVLGFWAARQNSDPRSLSYLCEYANPPAWSFGTVDMDLSGCANRDPDAQLAYACSKRTNQDDCNATAECNWNGAACVVGCTYIISPFKCLSRAPYCHLDYSSVPATCEVDVCTNAPVSSCSQNAACKVSAGRCQYKDTCERQTGPDSCANFQGEGCKWSVIDGIPSCTTQPLCSTYVSSSGLCAANDNSCANLCKSDTKCSFVQNGTSSTCINKPCVDCNSATATCDFVSVGNFAPSSAPVPLFAAPNAPATSQGFIVAIVAGYMPGDQLTFANTNPAFTGSWDGAHATLKISGSGDAAASTAALQSVSFSSSSNSQASRTVTWTLIETASSSLGPVLVPSQKAYFEYVAAPGISFQLASKGCNSRTGACCVLFAFCFWCHVETDFELPLAQITVLHPRRGWTAQIGAEEQPKVVVFGRA